MHPRRHRTTSPLLVESLEDRCTPATFPPGFIETTIAEGLEKPISMTIGPEGSIYVAEQQGHVRVIENDQLLDDPFFTVPVGDAGIYGERGLMSIAFHPDYQNNGYFYLYYHTDQTNPTNRISRFTATPGGIDPASELVLLDVPSDDGHNGGAMTFGNDGKLYVATGDLLIPDNSQTLTNLLGKILRLNPDGTVPEDNPFYTTATGNNRFIWALGLRNPFTFAFQPGTGRMFINDVGQATWEEINEGYAGANYGWPLEEGPSTDPSFEPPLFSYSHGDGPDQGWAITGGVFYNPENPQFPEAFVNNYFFSDFGNGWIKRIDLDTGEESTFATDLTWNVDLEVSADGALYTMSFATGKVAKIEYDPTSPPSFLSHPESQIVSTNEDVTFQADVVGPGTLSYQWLRNGVEIVGETEPILTLNHVSLSDTGAEFTLRATNEFGTSQSKTATLTVLDNERPTAEITVEVNPLGWSAGDEIRFSGVATDPEDGTLPADSYTWSVEYFTNSAGRPLVPAFGGATEGTFTIPLRTPYKRTDVFYRINLQVVDSTGLTFETFVDIMPRIASLTIQSDLDGVIRLDGQPLTTPTIVVGVSGVLRTLAAQDEVVVDGETYLFSGWSDGSGQSVHEFPWPGEDSTIQAIYRRVTPPILPPVSPPISPPVVPPVPPPPILSPETDAFFVSSGAGRVSQIRMFDSRGELLNLHPFEEEFLGGARVARAELDGDNRPDLAVVPGPGGGPVVKLFNGLTGAELGSFFAFEESFRGGLWIAAGDLNDDGISELVVSAGQNGGPRVQIRDGATLEVIVDFFAIEDPDFRGGARTSLGDLNGDGVLDLAVTAGEGGGPRVAVYDGRSIAPNATTLTKLFPDFFAFPTEQLGSVSIALGDVNGDEQADLIVGGGPGSGPRVQVVDGGGLLGSEGETQNVLADFFAGDSSSRGGVSVSMGHLDSDGLADLLVAFGPGTPPSVLLLEGDQLSDGVTQEEGDLITVFEDDFFGGVFVG